MADTKNDTQELVAPTTWNTSDSLRLDGDAVEKLAKLGALSTGVDILTIRTELENEGLPATIPAAVIHGERPQLISVKNLLEEWRERPERRRGTAVVGDLDSFCELLNRHKTQHSVVFAESDWRKPSLTAVIDYHDQEAIGPASHGQHRIRYDFPTSDEWKTWVVNNGEAMAQQDFAEFVEERIPDLTAPDDAVRIWVERDLQTTVATPAKLMELSRGLQIAVGAKVKNAHTLQTGEASIVFEEEHTGADGEPLKVPGAFVIRVPVFYGGDPVDIPVRLRYRLRGGALAWTYLLYRPDRIIGEALDHAKSDVKRLAGLPIYEGKPEMAGLSGA